MYCILILAGHHEHERNLGFSLFQTKDGVNCGFCLWSCQLWLYLLLLLSCEISRVLWLFSCSTVWRVYRFLDIVLMDSDHYRYIFRSTTIIFEITGISVSYSFSTISYRFRFREKNVKMKVIWSTIDRFRPFSSLQTSLLRLRESRRLLLHTILQASQVCWHRNTFCVNSYIA
jgi:hypothetical protein